MSSRIWLPTERLETPGSPPVTRGSSSKPVRVMTPQTCFLPRRLAHQPSSRHHTVAWR